ncbi:MAG: histidine kinase [Frankiales bacterium]|nr:histidine kinase [Frankiales bacterium]
MTVPNGGLAARVPLRTLVLSLLLATVALVVLLTSVAGVVALRGYLLDRVDDQLSESVRMAAGPGDRRGRPPRGRFPVPGGSFTAQFDDTGALLGAVEGLDGDDDGPRLPLLDATTAARLADGPFTVPSAGGGDDWRADVQPLASGGSVVVALPLGGVDATVRRLLLIDALVGVAALAAAGALGAAGVRRSLRPLTTVEQTAEAIAAGDLSVRVPVAGPRTEVGSLATSFNSMVDRFETAYGAQQRSEAEARASEERMRRFVGDASHELRTPLTSIRGFAELYRQGAVSAKDLPRVVQRIEDEAARMGLLVEDLLLLARLDQQRPLERTRVDLLTVAADVVHDAAAVTGHAVRLLPPQGPPPVVLGDDARLRQVLGNLVANATTHTPAGTTVEVALTGDDATVVLEVRDDGPGMSPDVAARVFERFYRADSSRTRSASATGSGLGLSIVAALVAAHGGSVAVDSEVGRGTTMRVLLPRAP